MKKGSAESIAKGALLTAAWLVLGILTGCAVSKSVTGHLPEWYQQPSGAYDTDSAKVFYGVGRATQLQNRTLQRVNADNHARLEMARLLKRYCNDLAREALAGDVVAAARTKELHPALKGLVNEAMQRAIVTDHWTDPLQGGLFALCQLNLDDFEVVLNAHRGLDADMRTQMQANLEIVHTRLSDNLQKNQ